MTEAHTPYVYLYQADSGILLLSDSLQALYSLPQNQRLCPPRRWLNCFSSTDQRRLKHAFNALLLANDNDQLQLSLRLNSFSSQGARRPVEHQLCVVLINSVRFICGRVSPIWNPPVRHPASHRQSVYWSALPFRETSRPG